MDLPDKLGHSNHFPLSPLPFSCFLFLPPHHIGFKARFRWGIRGPKTGIAKRVRVTLVYHGRLQARERQLEGGETLLGPV